LVLRLILFTGLQGADDVLYSSSAWHMSRGETRPGPDLFRTRLAYVGPIALLYRIFGANVIGLILPSLAASLALVLLAYALGRTLYSDAVARVAAVFAALMPLEVFYATTASTDLVLAAWIGTGTWLLCRAEPSRGHAVLAGLAWGAAHLTKESGLLLTLPAAAFLWTRARRSSLLIAGLTAASVVGLELLAYGVFEGTPLYRVQLARSTQSGPGGSSMGFLGHLAALPSFCLNPLDAAFPFGGGLPALSLAGCVWALWRDRSRSGRSAAWWLATGLVLTLFPISLFPYRPALQLQARMFAVLVIPGALLAAAFLVEGVGSRWPRAAWIAGACGILLSLACAVRIHQDGRFLRGGVEWAHRKLADHPGVAVVTDPRTAELLRLLSSYSPSLPIRAYRPDDPAPAVGSLLLDVPCQASASRWWNGVNPPPWWSGPVPPRRVVEETTIQRPWRLRGPRQAEERVVLSLVLP